MDSHLGEHAFGMSAHGVLRKRKLLGDKRHVAPDQITLPYCLGKELASGELD